MKQEHSLASMRAKQTLKELSLAKNITHMEKPKREFRFVLIIAGLIITLNLCSGIMGPDVINIGTTLHYISVTCGVIPFCLAFFLMDIFTNQYGFSYAKQLSFGIATCNFTMAIALYFLTKIPVSAESHQNLYYQSQFYPMIKAFAIGTIAIMIAFYINSKIFSKLFINFQGKYLWLRCIGATSIGELVYSSIFDGIFFAHSLNISEIITIIINNYSFKFMFEVLTLPMTYLLVNMLDKYECRTTIKYINFEPNV